MRAEYTRDHFPRLLGLLTYLAETGGAHIDELAFHFGVSPDRIREDLDTLWVAGLPGESPEDLIDFTFDDDDTYVALREGLGLDRPLRLTPRETVSVLLALRAIEGEVTGTLLREELTSLIASLEAQLPATTPSREGDPSLQALRAAARARDVVTFTYVSATDETSQRTIDPLRIEERSAGWFLIGYCHDSAGVRTFSIDRISDVQVSAASWCAPADALAGHADIPEMTSVQLVTEPALNWLAEKFSARDLTRRSDGHIEFTIEFYSKERMVRTLLSVADRVVSISPPEAAALVADRAQQALARLEA